MAILTPTELLTSREAIEAGVDDVSSDDALRAIRVAEAVMNKALGYRVANDAESITVTTSDTDRLLLPERVRSISAITDSFRGSDPVDLDDNWEVRGKGFVLYRSLGWRAEHTIEIEGEFGFEPVEDVTSVTVGDDEYLLGQRFVLLLAVRMLQSTETDGNLPAPAGAYLTSYQSEGAAFSFFTPDGDTTGYADLDKLLDAIGRHPSKGSKSLYTIGLVREPLDDIERLDFPFDRGRLL